MMTYHISIEFCAWHVRAYIDTLYIQLTGSGGWRWAPAPSAAQAVDALHARNMFSHTFI